MSETSLNGATTPTSPPALGKITLGLVITIASIGFLFDTYELLMFPVIGSNAVGELVKVNKDGTSPGWLAELGLQDHADLKRGALPTSDVVRVWAGRMLWIAAVFGGGFGLLGGWLIDRLGRKTIMIASILMYSFSPVAAAFSTDLWELVLFRCTTFIGVCVEMVAAVTWLAELFEDKRTREFVILATLATASLGGILVTEVYSLIIGAANEGQLPHLAFPAGHVATNVAWRFTLLTGLVPGAAILLLIPFVPESRVWKKKKQDGTLKRPHFSELFSPQLRRTTIVTTILSACGYAAAFGAIQLTPLQISGELPDMVELRTAANKDVIAATANLKKTKEGTPEHIAASKQLDDAKKAAAPKLAAYGKALSARRGNIQRWQEIGGLTGRILLAGLLLFLPGRLVLRLLLIPGLVLFPITYYELVAKDYQVFATAIFFCGLLTVAKFSFLSELLPKVFPMHLRGTGGSFATNFGGRMIGTMAATLNTEWLSTLFTASGPLHDHAGKGGGVASAAAVIGGTVYLIAFIASFLLPEPEKDAEKQAAVFGRDEVLEASKPAAAH